jgi:glycerol-3-phosphate acyltransferase PlsY
MHTSLWLGSLLFIFAYLIGSICSAVIVCRTWSLPDPRTQGSKNPGATNVMRLGGRLPALATLVADVLKGFLPVLIAHAFGVTGAALAWIGLAALLGHLFPVFFGFKGGKGVATALGVLLALSWPLALICVAIWALVFYSFRYVSLSSIAAAVTAPIAALIMTLTFYFWPMFVMALLIIVRHSHNILLLILGKEDKFNSRKK